MKGFGYIFIAVLLHYCLRNCKCSNLETRSNFKVIEGPEKQSYFGYNIVITEERALIAAPKSNGTSNASKPTDSRKSVAGGGFLTTCNVTFDDGKQCKNIELDIPAFTKGIGLSMAMNNTDLKVCAPASNTICGNSSSAPGKCYSSNDTGLAWDPIISANESEFIEGCPAANADMIFLLDGSQSLMNHFHKVLNWTAEVASSFNVEDGSVQIGVVQYSSKDHTSGDSVHEIEIPLSEHRSQSELTNRIMSISIQKGVTYTGEALEETISVFENGSRWKDNSTRKVLILLTDGRATDSERLKEAGEKVRSNGVTMFAVGAGRYSIEEELRIIANGNNNSNKNVLHTSDFNGLSEIADELSLQIRTVLEGSLGNGVTSYHMEMAETGFSMEFKK